MPAAKPFRIAVVDDHPIVRTGLVTLIESEPDLLVCGEAADIDAAMALVSRQQPDLVLVDLSLGSSNGLDLIRRLAERSVPVLVVSIHIDDMWVTRALSAGASGYVHKGEAARHVVEAIRAVQAGHLWVSPSIAGDHSSAAGNGQWTSPITLLSDREIAVFEQIGRGQSTRQIAEALHLSPKTVQSHRERIKAKLNLETSAELSARATRWVSNRPS